MPRRPHHLARGILRNAGAMFLVGAFAKGAGLVIAILVARFLGPDAMGLYAILFSIAFLLETFISLGMSDSLVRDIAARPAESRALYLASLKLVLRVSLVPAAALVLAASIFGDDDATRASLLVIAAGTPVSAAFVVSQAALQGKERVLLLTWVSFLARVLSLVGLLFAFSHGANLAAAFGSRVLFQGACLAVYLAVLARDRQPSIDGHSTRSLLTRSVPFAMNKAIRELSVRLPSFVLPAVAGLAAAGIFDAANRLRSTLAMVMSASIVGLMPAFARSLAGSATDADGLVRYSIKYMCVAMSVLATAVALLSNWIIDLLYGVEFAGASRPLQILIWAQVVTAVDAVLQQAMLARGDVYPAVRHSAAGVLVQFAMILIGAALLGLAGAALAVLLGSLLTLALDLRFVVRKVTPIPIWRFAVAPLAAAAVIGTVMLFLDHKPIAIRLAAAVGTWTLTMALFRVLPRQELRFMMQLLKRGRERQPQTS